MRKLFFTFFITAFLANVNAQKATLTGVVKDFKTTETIPGINVLYGPGKGTATDFDGVYTLNLEPGDYTIRFVSSLNYDTLVKKVTLAAGENKKLNVSLKEKRNIMNAVVISAGKFEQRLTDVTVSMETVDAELVENKATTNAADIVTQVPGVHTQEGQVSIRGGAGFSYGAGSRVLVMVDGIPMLSGDAGDVKWNYLPIENLESIEVVKGASSVLYGSSALNGTINIRTSYPKNEPITKVTLIGSVYDKPYKGRDLKWWDGYKGNQGLSFFHSRQIKNNFDLTIGGNFYNDASFRMDESETRGRININTRYRDKKVEGLSYGINANGQLSDNKLFFAWKNSDSVLTQSPGTGSHTKNNRFNVDPYIEYFTKGGDRHSLKTRMFITSNNSVSTANQSSLANLMYGEYQYQKNIDSSFKITSGVMGTYTYINSDLYGNHDSRNIALYSQLDKRLFDKLSVSAGIRGEYFKIDNEESQSTVSFNKKKLPFQPVLRAGLNYQAAEYTFLRASYGQGFRFPTVAEKFAATNVGAVNVFPNPTLQPETGWSAELGVKQGLKVGEWKGFLDVSGFINEYQNMTEYTFARYDTNTFQPVPSGINPAAKIGFSSRNVQAARITGVDVSLVGAGKIGGVKVTVLAGYTFMNPKPINPDSAYLASFSSLVEPDTNNYNQPHYDKNLDVNSDSVSMNLKYRFNHLFKFDVQLDYNRFSAGVSYRYNSYIHNIDYSFVEIGSQPSLNFLTGLGEYRERNRKGTSIIDFRFSYELNEYSKINFLVNNVTNLEYQTRPGWVMPPRTYVVQLSFKF